MSYTETYISGAPEGVFFPVLGVAIGDRYHVRFLREDEDGILSWSLWHEFTLPPEYEDGDALVSRLCCGFFVVTHTPAGFGAELVREACARVSSNPDHFIHAQYKFERLSPLTLAEGE